MKIFIIIFAIIVIALTSIYFFIGNYFYNIALSPKTSKTFVLGEDAEEVEQQEKKWIRKSRLVKPKFNTHIYNLIK